MPLRPYQQVTTRKGFQRALPPLPLRPPGAGAYVQGGNVVDVGGRAPALGPPIQRTPAPAPRAVGPPVVPPGGAPGPAGPGAPAGPAEDPWAQYLRMLDERERASYDREAALRQARAKDLMAAMSGFSQALQGNAAEQWANVIKGYGRAGDTATAYDQALGSSYGTGLTDANRQIAADFAAIHQGGGPTTLRDDAAALQQITTEGGARPGETMGLVGRAWGSYGETRPGSIGFMTGQNISQVAREALQADENAQVELIKQLADNPQQAVQMWQAMQSYKDAQTKSEADAAQRAFENHLAETKEGREQQAWLETLAKTRTDQTGQLWVVKNGKVVPSKAAAPGSAAARAQTQAQTTRRGQDVSAKTAAASLAERRAHNTVSERQAQARLGMSQKQVGIAQQREDRLAKSPQKGGYTRLQKQTFRGNTRTVAMALEKDKDKAGKDIPKTDAGNPRPRDVIAYAMAKYHVPFSVAMSVIQNLAETRYKGDYAWTYAAANW
jgi:hypothetical protein